MTFRKRLEDEAEIIRMLERVEEAARPRRLLQHQVPDPVAGWLTMKDLAWALEISRHSVYRLVASGALQRIRRNAISELDIRGFLRRQEVTVTISAGELMDMRKALARQNAGDPQEIETSLDWNDDVLLLALEEIGQ